MDPIKCVKCGQSIWCLYIKGEGWICKTDYLDMGYGTFSEWNRLNDEARKRREEKRRMEAEGGEYQDYSPRPQCHPKSFLFCGVFDLKTSVVGVPYSCLYLFEFVFVRDRVIPN